MKKQLTDVICELHVPSFDLAKNFYQDLGFQVIWERKSTNRTEGYMVMRRGTSVLCFYSGTSRVYNQEYFKQFPPNTKRGYAVEIVVPIDDIKSFYTIVTDKHKSAIIVPLSERFYYQDFRIVDPFGFYIRFVERYNWVDTRNPDGSPKQDHPDEVVKYKKLMTADQKHGTREEDRNLGK